MDDGLYPGPELGIGTGYCPREGPHTQSYLLFLIAIYCSWTMDYYSP